MNPITLTILLSIWQADDSKFLDSIRAIPILQHERHDQQHDSGSPESVEIPKVTIEFTEEVSSGDQLVRTTVKATTPERYLVSESWCVYCPAAKTRFLNSGGKPENIIDIATAKAMGHSWSGGVPHEFTRQVETTREVVNPPTYRRQWPGAVTLNGTATPTKSAILRHLRDDGPHQGKHWQSWYLESWEREQLIALHDDDHNGTVPTFSESVARAEALLSDVSPSSVAEALALHLVRNQEKEVLTGSLFSIDADVPDGLRLSLAEILSRQSIDFPSAGVSVTWGGDRTISIGKGKLSIKPGAEVAVRRFGVSVSAKLTGASFSDDLSWVTLELDGAPDLTVRLKGTKDDLSYLSGRVKQQMLVLASRRSKRGNHLLIGNVFQQSRL